MKEGFREHIPIHDERRKTEEFRRFLPEAEMSDAVLVEMPDEVQELLEQLGMMYLDVEKYEPGKFHDTQKMSLGPDEAMYIACRIKEYPNVGTEESSFLIDFKEGKVMGYGEIRYNLTDEGPYFKDKPFVGITRTMGEYRRLGLAERRLRAMNALSQQKYGNPVYSDTVISPGAQALWDKLVKEGRARKFKEGKHDRYVYEAGDV